MTIERRIEELAARPHVTRVEIERWSANLAAASWVVRVLRTVAVHSITARRGTLEEALAEAERETPA